MDTDTKMFWKIRKQSDKDSEIYGSHRMSGYMELDNAAVKLRNKKAVTIMD